MEKEPQTKQTVMDVEQVVIVNNADQCNTKLKNRVGIPVFI